MYKVFSPLPVGLTHSIFDADQTLYPNSTGFEKEHILTRIYGVLHEVLTEKYGLEHTYEKTLEISEIHFQENYSSIVGVARDLGLDMRALLHTIYDEAHIDYAILPVDQNIRDQLLMMRNRYRLRLAILSNGTDLHAHKVVARMGLDGIFGLIHGVNHHAFYPKPDKRAFEGTLWELNTAAENSILFEDSLRNLKSAREMGFGYNVYIGEHEPKTPKNEDNAFDLWAQTIGEALEAVNKMLEAQDPEAL